MFGIELHELFLFSRQFGLAAAGAASLWGLVLLKQSPEVSKKLLWVFFPPFCLFIASWLALAIIFCAFCAEAHEGISLAPDIAGFKPIISAQLYLFLSLAIWGSLGLFVVRKNLLFFYGVSFILISALLLYPWNGEESLPYILSSALHSWHSILTVGTVLVVDFLFTILGYKFTPLLKNIFPLMTKAIFLGLGLDFLSAGLIFNEAFAISDKLLFMQTLVGIIVINGVFLSGPILRAALEFRERMKRSELPTALNRIIGLSGSISITGWLSITALDGFRSLNLSYWQLFLIYITLVSVVYFARVLLDRVKNRLIST